MRYCQIEIGVIVYLKYKIGIENKIWFVFTTFTLKQFGDDYNTTNTGLHHPNCHEECPNQCSNNWTYYTYADGWLVDRSINVSCGKTFII